MACCLLRGANDHSFIADLPAVAERAVEHRATPELGEARDVRHLVVHAHGEYEGAGGNFAAAVQLDDEVFALLACAARKRVSDLNGVVLPELVPSAPIELVRRRPLESQQSAHVVRGAVALLALVE